MLTRAERRELRALERAADDNASGDPYLPEGCGECPQCSTPARFGGLCRYCLERLTELRRKATEGAAE
jgi:hypothetical protein